MKIYDDVKVINDNEKYAQEGVYKGLIGYINMPEIRDNYSGYYEVYYPHYIHICGCVYQTRI